MCTLVWEEEVEGETVVGEWDQEEGEEEEEVVVDHRVRHTHSPVC